jgi:uncharacterized protein YodC (DUF2158 family)
MACRVVEAPMNEFKKGDLVEVKSGSPVMTVADFGDYTSSGGPKEGVKCIWFDRGGQQEAVFDSAVLKRHEEGGSFRQRRIVRG